MKLFFCCKNKTGDKKKLVALDDTIFEEVNKLKEKIKGWIFEHIGGRVYASNGENEHPITKFIFPWTFKKLREEAMRRTSTTHEFSAVMNEVLKEHGYIKEV